MYNKVPITDKAKLTVIKELLNKRLIDYYEYNTEKGYYIVIVEGE